MRKTIKIISIFALLEICTACSFTSRFKKSDALKTTMLGDSKAVIALTYVVLGKDSSKNKAFWKNTMAVLGDVSNQPGYLGHGVKFKLFGGEAWRMTAWEDEQSLNAFIQTETHGKAMRDGGAALADACFARVVVNRSDIPISWKKAKNILAKKGLSLRHGPKEQQDK